MRDDDTKARLKALPIWSGDIDIAPLGGGLTNVNYVVTDSAAKYVVRIGQDIPEHHVLRFNELAASRAAHAAGLSPAVIHAEDGILVLEFIDGRTLTPKNIQNPETLSRVVNLLRRCHQDIPAHLRGPAVIFWVFHIIRDYAARLADAESPHSKLAQELAAIGNRLENMAGPFDMVFGHNDLLAANIMDDGARLWLIDWDYAGFNTPLFDLGGLASNNDLGAAQETAMLETYFEVPITDDLLHRFQAMKCASLLRETLWSMVSEMTSTIEFDYGAYTDENLGRFQAAYDMFQQSRGQICPTFHLHPKPSSSAAGLSAVQQPIIWRNWVLKPCCWSEKS
jgi:thiamine kinase-like enzyme